MTGRRQRDLADSFRLLASDEQWFLRDLLVGAFAFVLWAAGTGALATRAAGALGIPLGLASGESPPTAAIAGFAVLWLLVPAIAVVFRLRQRTQNLRGNVEQCYRLDHPAALLAVPTLVVGLLVGSVVALGAVRWYVTLIMLPVGLFVLVRTLAFSYRVYAFSHPLLVEALIAVSTVLLLGSALAAIGTATGHRTIVDEVLRQLTVPGWLIGTLTVEGVSISGLAVAALLPVALAAAYVTVQTVVALLFRLVKPDVDRSGMRTGQRYPPFLPMATPVQPSSEPTETRDQPSDVSESLPADSDTEDAASDERSAADETNAADGTDDDLDDVSNTRVFTPPSDDSAGLDPQSDGSPEPVRGGAEETRAVPGTDAGDDGGTAEPTMADRDHCGACGESFSVDTAVRFCPNCGSAVDGE